MNASMSSTVSTSRLIPVIAGIAALGLGIGSATGITGLDEYWHAMRTALQSLENGDWFVLTLDGEPRVEKPPLFYWMMMASMNAFGVDFWSARLPALVAGIALAGLISLLYRRLFDRSGLLAFLLTLSMFTVMVESRRAMLDLPVATCVAATVVFFINAVAVNVASNVHRIFWFTLAVGAVLAGFLIKGPVALWFVLAAGIAAWFRPLPDCRGPSGAEWACLIAALLVLLAAWPVITTLAVPDLWSRLADDSVDRQIGLPSFGGVVSIIGALVVAGLPWSAVAASAARGRCAAPAQCQVVEWLVLWLVIALIPFLFMKTFERYLLPLVTPLVVLTAHALSVEARGLRWKLLSACVLTALPAISLSGLFLWFRDSVTVDAGVIATWLSAYLVLVLIVAATVGAFAQRAQQTVICLTTALALTLGVVYPSLGVNSIPDDIIRKLDERPLAHYASPYPGTLSMKLRRSVPFIAAGDSARLRQLADRNGVVVLRLDDFAELSAECRVLGVQALPLADFATLYSRGAFLRITRPGATSDDWRDAFRERSLAKLTPRFLLVRLST